VNPTTLKGVTVVDTRDGSLAPNRDVTIDGGRITAIGPATATGPTSGSVIDAHGKFLVPGYLEMHAHPLQLKDPSGALELMLARGITGFRQMSGSAQMLKRRADGTLSLPAASPSLLAIPGAVLTPFNAGTEAAAVATVAEQHEAGADFIKVGLVTPEVLYAAQAEAARRGIPILGHLPPTVDVEHASQNGFASIEHLGPGLSVLATCSSDVADVRAALAARSGIRIPKIKVPLLDRLVARLVKRLVINPVARAKAADLNLMRHTIDTFDEGKARALAERFVADGTWQCPTLIRKRTTQLCDAPEYRDDPNLRFVADSAIRTWTSSASRFARRPAEQRATLRDEYALAQRLTRLFDDTGVKMIAGSDACGAIWQIAGYSLHQEFDELAAAGLSPLRVLRMATLDAAEFLGTTATMGTVDVGKNADLALLDGDPTADVKHLHQVSGVVRAGRYYTESDLDNIKRRVAAAKSVE
jgi:imidazolonepropionase-like amidohydrolase